MKKVLGVIAALLLAALGLVAYQWYRASQRLAMAARGGIYRNLGLKLELAPSRDGVKGFTRLRPYVEIPQVVLDPSAWGWKGSVPLGSARLSTSLWQSSGLLLVFEPGSMDRDHFEAKRVAFELGLPDLILGARAEALIFNKADGREKLVLHDPWIQVGIQESVIPERMNFRIESIDYSDEKDPQAPVRVHLGAIDTGYTSERKGEDRVWNFFHSAQGGAFESPGHRGDIQGWNKHGSGSFHELPSERWKQLFSDWKEIAESLPTTGAMPEAGLEAALTQRLPQLVQFLVDLRPKIDAVEFRWGGLAVTDAAKVPQVNVGPVAMEVAYADEAGGMKSSVQANLKGLRVQSKDGEFEMNDLTFSQKSGYAGLHYQDWLRYFVRYYAAAHALRSAPGQELQNFQDLFRSYLAQMPDHLNGEFRFASLKFRGPRYQAEHHDFLLSGEVEDQGWKILLKDGFDSILPNDPDKSIHGAKVDLSFLFRLPWAELVKNLRGPEGGAESRPDLLQTFSGKPAGMTWQWLIDLGANLFALHLDLSLDGDAAKIAASSPMVMDSQTGKPDPEAYAQNLLKALLGQGQLHVVLQIDRLSRLQAALDKIKSGSSMALALAGAYVVVDPKADTLRAELILRDGRVLLNGRKNDTIEALLKGSIH